MKQEIYNLIILDESGSMNRVIMPTITGCNETIDTIHAAQDEFADTQTHFVSIYSFSRRGRNSSRYLIKNEPAADVKHIEDSMYSPGGGTPLYDAIGDTLTDLQEVTKDKEMAIGSVTIITDGMENSSERFTAKDLSTMIDKLKEMGWNFSLIGANIDVRGAAGSLSIENFLEFQQDHEGMRNMWRRERRSRMDYYARNRTIMDEFDNSLADNEDYRRYVRKRMRAASTGYFDSSADDEAKENKAENKENVRIIRCGRTPEHISMLRDNEVFVFGSNLDGCHAGGAAAYAMSHFGAQWGKGVGMQGHSYAIPTMHGGIDVIKPYVDEFIRYAGSHPELYFYVTKIGCGIAGFATREIAPLFVDAIEMKNVSLPKEFIYDLRKLYPCLTEQEYKEQFGSDPK